MKLQKADPKSHPWKTTFRAFMKDIVLDIIHDGWEGKNKRNSSLWKKRSAAKGSPWDWKYPEYAPFEMVRTPISLTDRGKVREESFQPLCKQMTKSSYLVYGPLFHNITAPLSMCENGSDNVWSYPETSGKGFNPKPVKVWDTKVTFKDIEEDDEDDAAGSIGNRDVGNRAVSYKDTQAFVTNCKLTPDPLDERNARDTCNWFTRMNDVPDPSSLFFASRNKGGCRMG